MGDGFYGGSGGSLRVIPLRLYLYAAAALAVAGLAWFAKHQYDRASVATLRAETAEASIVTLTKAHAHQLKIAQEASNGYQNDLRRLESERARVPVVRLCRPPRAAGVPASGAAANGSDAAGAGHLGGEASPDIGAALIDYGIACEANALQLDRLIQWVRSR